MKIETLFEGVGERLCCPICKHYPLEIRKVPGKEEQGALFCSPCARVFCISNGIPDFLPPEANYWKLWKKRLKQFDRRATGWTEEDAQERIPTMEGLFQHFHPFKGSLLDIGCGDGEVRSFLGDVEYWGIDPEDWITSPKHTFNKESLFPGIQKPFPLFLGVGEYLPFKDQVFDNILIFSSFDHVQSPREVLRESFRVLKRGGSLVVMLQLSDPEYQIPRSKVRKLGASLQRGISKLPKGDFLGFAKGMMRTLFDKPDLSFTKKGIEELFGTFFLNLEMEILPGGDTFVRARKP